MTEKPVVWVTYRRWWTVTTVDAHGAECTSTALLSEEAARTQVDAAHSDGRAATVTAYDSLTVATDADEREPAEPIATPDGSVSVREFFRFEGQGPAVLSTRAEADRERRRLAEKFGDKPPRLLRVLTITRRTEK
ncbi:hypothetical protein [Streptomyces sp. NRRL F-5630]|uniref:hypothetical protein n=1 Tax=Streptomyces sp. NRRL F-5630 TaxID=1463864 RepID=UPI003EC08911